MSWATGGDFSNKKLRNVDFSNAKIVGANMSNASFEGEIGGLKIGPLWTLIEETWWHNRFMNRDIDMLEGS